MLRKYWMCRCGCRGWCSVFCIMKVMHWSMLALTEGVFPAAGPFGPLDSVRSEFAGSSLGLVGACIFLKADWSEYAHNLGFWTWASKVTHCPLCDCKGSPSVQSDGFDPLSLHWRLWTYEDYTAACDRCEKWVVVPTAAVLAKLKGLLFFDKRQHGSRGKSLAIDMPELLLEKGDR